MLCTAGDLTPNSILSYTLTVLLCNLHKGYVISIPIVGPVGLKPTTRRLRAGCSIN